MQCRWWSLAVWVLLSILLLNCGPAKDREPEPAAVASSFAAYLAPTRSETPLPLQWVEASLEEVYPELASTWNSPSYRELEAPETRRLQFWLDALYEELLASDGSRLRLGPWQVPRPRIRIMNHASLNAFVSSRPVCYRSRMRLANDLGLEGAAPQARLMINKKGKIGLYPKDKVGCLDRSTEEVPAEWIAAYLDNNVGVSNCSYQLIDGSLVFGAECQVGGPAAGKAFDLIGLESVTPWITITTGLLGHFSSEAEIVLSLAHELVHYFHAHGALVKSNFHYFYRLTDANLARPRPEPDPSLNELGETLRKLPEFRTQAIEGQIFHSEMFSYFRTAVKHLIRPACGEKSSPCFESCRSILALGEDVDFQKRLLSFPQASLEGLALAQYFQYEKDYRQCGESIKIVPESQPHQGTLGIADVKRIYWKAKLEPLPAELHLAEAIEDMNQQLLAEERERSALLQKALDENLGYYTTEVEADLLALQWLARLGFEPSVARGFWFEFMRVSREQDSPYNFAFKRCRHVYEALPPWTSAGQSVRVPVGSFAGLHPSKCHRLYQVDRRLRLVSFPQGRDRRAEAIRKGGPWEQLFPKALDSVE